MTKSKRTYDLRDEPTPVDEVPLPPGEAVVDPTYPQVEARPKTVTNAELEAMLRQTLRTCIMRSGWARAMQVVRSLVLEGELAADELGDAPAIENIRSVLARAGGHIANASDLLAAVPVQIVRRVGTTRR